MPSYAIIVREYFPPREAASRVGLTVSSTMLGMALGGWMGGVLFDMTGSYRAAFINGIALERAERRHRLVAAQPPDRARRHRLRSPMRITAIRDIVSPIRSNIANAYIDFSQMTASVVAIVTDLKLDGGPVVGYGFNSNGRYAVQGLLRERFIPRLAEAQPDALLDEGGLIDPAKCWEVMMRNEKPGGHGERSVAVGVLDMALWDLRAKAEGKPLWRLLADRYRGGEADRQGLGLRRRRLLLPRQGH